MREVTVDYPTDWAQVDSTGKVVNVISAMREQIASRVGDGFVYVESSDVRPALMGGVYHANTDTFSPSKPFASWTWNDTSRTWIPPTVKPSNDTFEITLLSGFVVTKDIWEWSETSLSWVDTRPA